MRDSLDHTRGWLLKAVAAHHGQPIPRTHDLVELNRLCVALTPEWSFSDVDASELTPFAVQLRYDVEFWPDRATAVEALRRAERARAAAAQATPRKAHPDNDTAEPST